MIKRLFYPTLLLLTLAITSSFKISSDKEKSKQAHVKNVILMIGDGMGLAHIYASYTVNGSFLNILNMPVTGLSKTNSKNRYITDSAAGATALSTGKKTNNGMLAIDSLNNTLKTILEIAEDNKYATGLVVTCAVTHATPAAFISHIPDREESEDIAKFYLKTDIDVFIGGGLKYFMHRKDNLNLVAELENKGYQVDTTMANVELVKSGKLAGLVAQNETPYISKGRGDMLPKATKTALNILKQNKNGFFLLVEGSQIDWGAHNNSIDNIVNETLDFDKAVAEAIEFAKKDGNTLVIVTADHETGGLTLINGDIANKDITSKFSTTNHTASPVPVFAYGPGAEAFTGFYENTEIFYKMMNAFGFSAK
jgi:alkaline phosphatase